MGTLIILAAIGVIILWVFIALEFKGIAEMKGHDSMRYFWWTFILGPIGMLMVIALPQETKDSVIVYRDEPFDVKLNFVLYEIYYS